MGALGAGVDAGAAQTFHRRRRGIVRRLPPDVETNFFEDPHEGHARIPKLRWKSTACRQGVGLGIGPETEPQARAGLLGRARQADDGEDPLVQGAGEEEGFAGGGLGERAEGLRHAGRPRRRHDDESAAGLDVETEAVGAGRVAWKTGV